MKCELKQNGGELTAALYGEIDQHCVNEIREQIDRELDIKNIFSLIIDLKNVGFMDSSGLGLIMGRYKKINARGGKMKIIGQNPETDRLLELSGIKKLIDKE